MAARKKAARSATAKKTKPGTPRKTSAPSKGTPTPRARAADESDLATSVAQLRAEVGRLREAVAEIPRAAEFEPLAEHIYSFATIAPRLLESLEAIPQAVEPIEASVRALTELADTLQVVHQSFSESILRLPSAEDYEPLAAPLREFARVSPALTESLAGTMRSLGPLHETIRGLRNLGTAGAGSPKSGLAAERALIEEVAAQMEAARDLIVGALQTLPRDPEYGRVASQLRELATVSPSIMDMLREVRTLSMPLGESVQGLERCAEGLTRSHQRLVELLRRLPGGPAS